MIRWKLSFVCSRAFPKRTFCDTFIDQLAILLSNLSVDFKTLCLRMGSYDPLEKAYQENKQLIAAYRERMQNSNKGRRNQDVMARVRKQDKNCKLKK